jgi:hypothetical protein
MFALCFVPPRSAHALYLPVPHLTVAYCDINAARNESNLWLLHHEQGVESTVMNSFRCGMFKLHWKQWISASEHTEDAVAEDGVEVEASKATATTEIRDWLSTAFGELTVAPATCAPRYLTLSEMVCQVNQEIRELEAVNWPSHERYCDFLPHTFPPWASVDQNTQKSMSFLRAEPSKTNMHTCKDEPFRTTPTSVLLMKPMNSRSFLCTGFLGVWRLSAQIFGGQTDLGACSVEG